MLFWIFPGWNSKKPLSYLKKWKNENALIWDPKCLIWVFLDIFGYIIFALPATIMKDLRNIDIDLPKRRDENLTNILLYGIKTYDDKTNQITLMHAIQ